MFPPGISRLNNYFKLTIMKKHLFYALAALGMVACMQDEVVTVQQDAISFKGAFVENATRAAADPSTTVNTIADFNVWGFMDQPSGYVFTGDKVAKAGNVWTYANTQYWAPGHTYYFAAVSPADSQNWTLTEGANTYGPGVVSFTNVDGSEDLLYAATSVETPRVDDLKAHGMDAVKLHFSHLLSKVKFTFKNGFATDNMSLEVKDIIMTAPKTGEIDLAVENWWDNDDWKLGTEKIELAFGNVALLTAGKSDECVQERLTIPVDKNYEYQVTFTVVLYTGDVKALETTKTTAISGVALEMGKAYNFSAEINPENLHLPSIEFDVVEVKDWDQAGDRYVPGYAPTVKVANAFDFEAALAAKCPRIQLIDNIELTSEVTKVIGDLVLDLNGFNISAERNVGADPTADIISTLYVAGVEMTVIGTGKIENLGSLAGYSITVAENGKVTIKGDVTVGSYYDAFYVRKGELYIEDGFHYASEYSTPKVDAYGCHASTVINCYDNDGSDVYVTGGTFVNMDPSNVHEWKLHHMSFVVDGYKVVAEDKGDGSFWYTVIPE